ncbi:MAG: hypothetical protein ACTSWY_08010 [Promethearchaeota archaeon]
MVQKKKKQKKKDSKKLKKSKIKIKEESDSSKDAGTKSNEDKMDGEKRELMEIYKREFKIIKNILKKETSEKKNDSKVISIPDGTYVKEEELKGNIEASDASISFDNLTTKEDQRKIKRNLGKLDAYLEELGIEEKDIDFSKNILIIPFEYENLQFLSHVIIGVDWFIVKASILELKNIPKHLVPQTFFELLKTNFILNDVTYSIDPEGKSIWCEADIPSDLDFSHFKLEYLSIVFAIDYFIKNISNQITPDQKLQSTYHSEDIKSKNGAQLYI